MDPRLWLRPVRPNAGLGYQQEHDDRCETTARGVGQPTWTTVSDAPTAGPDQQPNAPDGDGTSPASLLARLWRELVDDLPANQRASSGVMLMLYGSPILSTR